MENSLARHGRCFPHRGIRSTLDLGDDEAHSFAHGLGLRATNSPLRGLGICTPRRTERLPATHPVRYTITRLEHPLDWPVLNRPQLAAFEVAAEALATVRDPTPAFQQLDRLAKPVRVKGRALRGFNPIDLEDFNVFRAVLRGEHAILGFKNRDVRRQLYTDRQPSQSQRTLAARVSRILKRLHVRDLIVKIPRSQRWRVTRLGHDLMAAALQVRDAHFFQALTPPAPT